MNERTITFIICEGMPYDKLGKLNDKIHDAGNKGLILLNYKPEFVTVNYILSSKKTQSKPKKKRMSKKK